MKTINELGDELQISREELEAAQPSAFVSYKPVKKMSSQISLAASDGIIRKAKLRSPEKAIYEYLALEVWNDVLREYSEVNDLTFKAPKPVGLIGLDSDTPEIFMSYINGHELSKIGQLKRTFPVNIKGQDTPLPIYPACAFHLGALDRIKINEGLYHNDYTPRHIIFTPNGDVSISVVDVENSRLECSDIIGRENDFNYDEFEGHTSSPKDSRALTSWYDQGAAGLRIPESDLVDRVVDKISKRYDTNFDFKNPSIGNFRISPNE